MYVIYPASHLVGLTINYREINQVRPFPPKHPSEERQNIETAASVKEAEIATETPTERPELLNEGPNETNSNKKDQNNSQRSYSKNNLIETSDNHSNNKSEKEKENNSLKASDTNIRKKSVSPINKRSKSESPKNKSESPQSVLKKIPSKRQIKNSTEEIPPENPLKSPVENRQAIKILTLEENLKNLEVYRVIKPPLKRSWSLHFKKAVTTEIIRMTALECALREMTHPALNETLKAHNAVAFKLVKTVSEFTEALAHIYEQHAEEMQLLVSNFRKKNSELRKERPACASSLFHTWETLLQEVEIDSQAHSDIASILGRQVSRPLLEKSFFRKIQSKKVFSNRESYESLIKQNEEKLGKTRIEYKTAYLAYMNNPSTQALANYINSHNEYVSQLHLTNGMLSQYHSETLPMLLQELEDIYSDLCATMSDSVLQGAEMISSRAQEQSKRYEGLTSQCRAVQGPTDLAHLVRSVTIPTNHPPVRRHFAAPQPPPPQDGPDGQPLPVDPAITANLPPALKNEIVVDRLATMQVREKFEAAKKECLELETQIKQLTDALHTLTRVQQRSVDSNLFNKVNELQEDIGTKQYELNVALMRLAAFKAQKELFSSKVESADTGRDRKMSSSSTGSMKSKWMKAFKSLKTSPTNGTAAKESENPTPETQATVRKNGKDGAAAFTTDSSAHSFQDYTYKKITPCDVCSQVLRGHTRQGLKCRVCKLNVHVDCQEKAPKCQQKSRLLRRQKSTSEIDTKIQEPPLEEETPRPTTAGTRQVHYDLGPAGLPTGQISPPTTNLTKSRTLSQSNLDDMDSAQRRRLFAGFKSLSVFGGKSRGDSPNSRSISLPENAERTRPFGQPLFLGATIQENGGLAVDSSVQQSPQAHHRTKTNRKR